MNQNSQKDQENFSSNHEEVEFQKQASNQTEEIEQYKSEAIAIIGIGCRFPGANNYEEFWLNLEAGVNSITEIPPQRWDVQKYYSPNPQERNKTISKWSGFIEASDQFDTQFFGISPREAKMLDPQQRLMLELSWSCLEDAGYSPSQLSGSPVGVFIGACNYDSILNFNQDQENIEGHIGTGTWTCMIPNRISHFFDFRGPSIPVDTACSSSLVAIHLAINALKEKECEIALVGGISVLNIPTIYIQMSQLGMLSPTGQCHSFDSHADGYVRGEGAGIILLKPLAKAIEDQDHIYGVIKGSAINHGGKSRTLTSPNIYAQAQVLRTAYTKANIAPNTVSYIEAHGTGTPLGDPIEINALKRAFRQLYQQYKLPGSAKPYCGIGTVKTNIGHLEGAAGIAGVIKVLLAMKQKKLPKILNFQQLNPRIELENSPFYIVAETQEWQQLKTEAGEVVPRRAGVSSFGAGGVNVHVVLEEAPQLEIQRVGVDRPLHILTLAAKNEQALRELVKKYQGYLQSHQEVSTANICFTANTGRNHFQQRLAVIGESNVELQQQLSAFIKVNQTTQLMRGQARGESPKVAFLFTGEGSEYVNMGWQLYQTQPTFRQVLEQCDQILRSYLDQSLLSVLYPQSTAMAENSSLLDQKAYSQPALFAIEYALAKLWQSWGIQPDVVMGDGVGEYVVATVAGVFSLEDAIKLITTRTRLVESRPGELAAVAKEVNYSQPQIPIISHLTGEKATSEIATPEYWIDIKQPIHFAQSIQTLHQSEYKLFLEISPKPILIKKDVGLYLPSLNPDQEDWQQMLSSLGQLYVQGVKVDWLEFDKNYPRRKLALPTYPFQRQRYWPETSEKRNQENGHQQDILENDLNTIAEFLKKINTEQLADELNVQEQLTEQEQKLLPKILKILTARFQEYSQVSEQVGGILQQLEKTPQRERQQLMIHYLQGVVSQLLGFDDSQSPDSQLGFFDMGMNYAIMIEFRNLLETSFNCSIAVTTLSEHFNIQKLGKYLITKIFGGELEQKLEIDSNENQQTVVDRELKALDEEAIASAMQEQLIATALQDELKEIQLLLYQEI
ncbi:type I polyketide synthase [Anabaena sp. UHCC 0451]|uniref:type I polyketide synthase n=1 Tax=Anabaena sp. UHCC 0451 TaxID=2055235 RepID=UPI000CA35E90|nr:beta-ketoacyl synthase N-terminal-like domain-containing protein [Anabaena sp. UHCC 0451]ATX68114.1 malonyl CoA-acyl carrier protein transacylase [Anabaena sp. UHCC 0451]MEA5576038.1 beta-ketoacyl synthase N-terminal-like domain-containing protein [Anabaena sp. UHCC 0451]